MMYLMEPLFDIAYLGLVIALGFRLILERDKKAKRFGLMSLILGIGDAFHLIPRVISNLTLNGFSKFTFFLSMGELVTSLTMTLFYVLFFQYYSDISKDKSKLKKFLIYALAIIRIIFVSLPQNLWGTEGSYVFGILRNIPFLLMGILLVIWTYRYRDSEGIKHTSLLISLSFLFYIPVVIFSKFIPIVGVLMIPKTIAYVLLVICGFKFFINEFSEENILKDAIVFLFMGLIGGVFYREFTRLFEWQNETVLSLVHVHLLSLGFLTLLVIYSIIKNSNLNLNRLTFSLKLYITGLIWTVVSFMVRGIYSITSPNINLFRDEFLSKFAGLGHILLGVGIVLIFLNILNNDKKINVLKAS